MGDGGRRWWREFAFAAVAAIASTVVAGIRVGAPGSLRDLWGQFDLTTAYAGARTLLTNLWLSPTYDLGYPFGQDLSNFPAPDLLNIAALKGLVLVTGDPAVAVNAYLVLSFAAITVASYALLRVVRIPPVLAAALAFSVSLLPWHFDRFTHAFLANYSTVAVGLILVVIVLDGNLALGGPQRARGRTLLLAAGLAAFVGLTGTYYAVFTSIIAVVAIVFQALLGRRDRGLIGAIWFALLPTAITFVAAAAYRFTALGPGAGAAVRAPEESQFYGGDLFTLIRTTGLWSSGWPIPTLEYVPTVASTLEADARNSTVGVIAVSATFLVAGLILAANGHRSIPARVSALVPRLRYWPWLFLIALLFFMIGGFGQAFSGLLGFQIRSWGRLAIVVVLIGYLVLGLLVTAWASAARHPRAILAGAGTLVVVLTVLDVATMTAPIDRAKAAAAADDVRAYGAALDAALPAGCGVLTVPSYLFPEGDPGDGTSTYDPLLPYLYAQNPRWTYGGVRGSRAGQWPYDAVSRDLPTMTSQAKAAGLCAVQVDTKAFVDTGDPLPTLTALLGPPVATSPSGRWVTYSLASADTGAWTTDYALDPARVVFGFGFGPVTSTGATTSASLTGTDGTLVVVNPRSDAVDGEFAATVTGTTGTACTTPVIVSTPNERVEVPATGSAQIPVRVDAGGLAVVHVQAPPSCAVTLVNPRVEPLP